MGSVKNKIIKLRKKILYHNYLYYKLDSPVISDEKYDFLMKNLQILEKKINLMFNINSPTQRVGFNIRNSDNIFFHLTPMLSLDNVFNMDDYLKFENKVKNFLNLVDKIELCCEFKIDGLALNLIYKKGKLIKAVTRGDGEKGEDVTSNAIKIKTIPLNLNGSNIPDLMEIRGEVFIKNSDFIKLNNESVIKKEKIFSNARNVASGSLRHNNSEIVIKRKLIFYAYGYNVIQGKDCISNHYDKLQNLKRWGLSIDSHTVLCNGVKEVLSYYHKIEKKRLLLDFNIDGIVVKINSIHFQKILGNTSRSPRWAIAFKFQSIKKVTKVLYVDFQVGRTGMITPVARLEPVEISGVQISNVSLYSKKEISRIGLSVGDYVTICRSGDVIPKIINIVTKNIDKTNNRISFPKVCPICMYEIIQKKKDGHFYCSGGFNCIAQRKKSLHHFFSKKALNVKGLGPKLINCLVDNNYIKNPADVFKLKINELILLNNISIKSAEKILKFINKARSVSLSKVIYGFGIHEVGLVTAMLLSKYFKYLHKIIDANVSDFLKIDGLGPVVAKNIFNFFHDQSNRKLFYSLLQELNIHTDKNYGMGSVSKNMLFFNKKIVITGVFHELNRIELIKKIESLGGIVVNSISKKVNLIIFGKNPGVKLIQAKNLGIESIHNIKFLLN
ncbi:NAD-dependent DNA ligase LigA [Buchnera aphidicola]|uniref:NAD-dependent DNA ligase LigA n=1 Tax=Buchnera aphidicola TaxID=9 RepID=UPI00346477B1